MSFRALDENEASEVALFITENADTFARWYNAEIGEERADWLQDRLDENWLLVNPRIPDMFGSREQFMDVWPSLHGSAQGDPVTSRIEFCELWGLSDGVYLAAQVQHLNSPNGTKSHPETPILTRDPATGQLRMQYVHE